MAFTNVLSQEQTIELIDELGKVPETQPIQDYYLEEWERMVSLARYNQQSFCPLLEDATIVAVNDYFKRVEIQNNMLLNILRGLLR